MRDAITPINRKLEDAEEWSDRNIDIQISFTNESDRLLPKTSSTTYYRRGDGSKLSIRLLVLRVILLISVCWSSERF